MSPVVVEPPKEIAEDRGGMAMVAGPPGNRTDAPPCNAPTGGRDAAGPVIFVTGRRVRPCRQGVGRHHPAFPSGRGARSIGAKTAMKAAKAATQSSAARVSATPAGNRAGPKPRARPAASSSR